MKEQKKNLIYIYDTEHQKIIMIDGETGERIRKEDDEVTSFLKYLDENGDSHLLRTFSIWCARQINDELKPIQKKILDLAQKAVQENVETEDLNELYQETEGTAVAADSVGLRKGSQSAPAYLAARECINPDALEGAIQAARFQRLWAEMQDKKEKFSDKALKEIQASSQQSTIVKVRQGQIDQLLDLMNS